MFVFDCGLLMDYDTDDIIQDTDYFFRSYNTMYDAVYDLMTDFFEARSDYGDPVRILLAYVPENRYEEILNDFHYLCANTRDEMIKKLKDGEWV